jgi:methylated-DNA-[protein]-cysteine S-methyltransferase
MSKIYKAYFNSPIGFIEIRGTEEGIISINFTDFQEETSEVPQILKECSKQLKEYFEGKRTKFDIKLLLKGTEFQRKVWNTLLTIPYGNTVSYRDIAKAVDNEKAVRAVGNANSKNPISIIVPCHRVVGSNGSLTGYAGKLWRKNWLLDHERSIKERDAKK